jgi:hypothetical protein
MCQWGAAAYRKGKPELTAHEDSAPMPRRELCNLELPTPAGAATVVDRGLMGGRTLPHVSTEGGPVTVHESPGRVAPPVLASEGALLPGYHVVLSGRWLELVCRSSSIGSSMLKHCCPATAGNQRQQKPDTVT